MPIRNGKLGKPCKKCGKTFIPQGRACTLCDKCLCKTRGFSWL